MGSGILPIEKFLNLQQWIRGTLLLASNLASEEGLIPAEVVDRMLEGENKVKRWREH